MVFGRYEMAEVERRKEKRTDLSVKLFMNRLDTKDKEAVPIEVLDLSKAGIGFICEKVLEKGAVYEADLKIWTGDTIHAFIEIVRVSEEVGGGIFGGLFIGMPESDWCRIRVYETYQEFQEKA